MQVSIENKEGLKRLVSVTVPAEEFKKAYTQELRKVAKTARIDGFRKGHVPTSVLEKYYGANIIGEASSAVINSSLVMALQENNLDVPGMPEITIKTCDLGQDFVYEAACEVSPEVAVKPLSELQIEKVNAEITEDDINDMIETLRQQQAKWKVVDDGEANKDSLVKIDFEGRVDGAPFEGGKAEDFSLHLGSGRMIPGFSEQIVGHKAGDKFTIQVKFPEDYHAENLKGKDAEFDITVNSVSEQVLPEVNEDFVKLFGVKDGSMETFRKDLRRNMERELKRAVTQKNASNVYEAVSKQYGEFDVPKAAVDAEIKRLRERTEANFRRYGMTRLPELKDEVFQEEALHDARLGYAIRAIVADLKLEKADDATVNDNLAMIADAYENPEEVIKQLRADKQQMSYIMNKSFEDDVVKAILANAQVTDVKKSFKELIGNNQQ